MYFFAYSKTQSLVSEKARYLKTFNLRLGFECFMLVLGMIVLTTVKWNTEFRRCPPRNSSILGVFAISVCLIFAYSPRDFTHLHIPNKRKFWQWGSQGKWLFEIFYNWRVLKDVLIFHSKYMYYCTFLQRSEHCVILLGWRIQRKSLKIAQQ